MENQNPILELEDEIFEYLDNLREAGTIKMCGVAPRIEDEFLVSKAEAKALLVRWMKTFEEPSL